jgi:hypothetical protein
LFIALPLFLAFLAFWGLSFTTLSEAPRYGLAALILFLSAGLIPPFVRKRLPGLRGRALPPAG